MILVTAIIGIISGLAGHRTDSIFEYLERNKTPRAWWLNSRYGTGVLIGMFVFFVSVYRKEWRDEAVSKALISFVFVGVGTLVGYVLDGIMED
jgi:nitrate/nitrite transporter NarK